MKEKGFSLVEILVTVTIIAMLTAIGSVTYSQFVKQSRDSRRKADLEQIKSALEMYRSNNSYYPTNLSTLTGSPKYISTIPTDPLSSQNYVYQYEALPGACDNITTICSNYTIGAKLEGASSCTTLPTGDCITSPSTACNYCQGPYGAQ